MSNRTIASRGWLRGALLALSAAGALTFAPAALAQTPVTVSTTAAFNTAIANANAAGGSNIIILAPGVEYLPTAPITITAGDNLEIEGTPGQQATTSASTETVLSGQEVQPLTSNFITVAPGASLLMKGFAVTASATSQGTFDVVEVNGNAEFDNMAFYGNPGVAIAADQTSQTQVPYVVIDNTDISGGLLDGVDNNSGNVTLNNVTDFDNTGFGLFSGGPSTTVNNSLIAVDAAGDCEGTPTTVNNSFSDTTDDSGTCGDTDSSTLHLSHLDALAYVGGPTPTEVPTTGSSLFGAGNPMLCLTDDQRFYKRGSTCDVGAYQSSGTSQVPDTTPAVCTVANINETSSPATETVDATDTGGPGFGPDANVIGTFTRGSGTVAVLTDSATNPLGYDLTSPGATDPSELDAPSPGPLVVTASKSAGTHTPGDTSWQFSVTDWLGNTTTCS
ncbi:MAG: choice-of-anchor Q domain-containing protein [Solirubrobacteraceae bacterium]